MTGTTQENRRRPPANVNQAGLRPAGPLGRVTANSRAHWGMLLGGAAGGVIFNAISLAGGATRHGYDWISQPLGALSLGAGGTAQVVNFVLLGAGTCASAFAWRPTLAGGSGAVWYGILATAGGPAGVFDRLAWLMPTATGIALVVRSLIARDARISAVGTS